MYCTSFSYCSDKVQTRYCVDRNNCDTEFNKPLEVLSCRRSGSDKKTVNNETNTSLSESHLFENFIDISIKEDSSLSNTRIEESKNQNENQPKVVIRRITNSMKTYMIENPQQNISSCNTIFCSSKYVGLVPTIIGVSIIVVLFLFLRIKNKWE